MSKKNEFLLEMLIVLVIGFCIYFAVGRMWMWLLSGFFIEMGTIGTVGIVVLMGIAMGGVMWLVMDFKGRM